MNMSRRYMSSAAGRGGGHAWQRRRRTGPSYSVCTVNTALNRGVSQRNCDRCTTGYRHWPCNELGPEGDILCFCSESLLSTSARRAPVKGHRFLGLIQRSDDVRAGAWSIQAQEEL